MNLGRLNGVSGEAENLWQRVRLRAFNFRTNLVVRVGVRNPGFYRLEGCHLKLSKPSIKPVRAVYLAFATVC